VSSRVPFVAGNWKMHKTASATRTLLGALVERVGPDPGIEVGVAPPFTSLAAAREALGSARIRLGAQNLYPEVEGAFTGEISPVMLADAGVDFVIVGHSERRAIFGESDEMVARKLRAAQAHDLTAVVCCGETLAEREAGRTHDVVRGQLTAALAGLGPAGLATVVVAYEPVWAIGTGRTATPEQAQEVHAFVRGVVARVVGAEPAARLRILYGGSVKPDNAAELMDCDDVDGALVGGASLDAASFAAIVTACARP